MLPAGRSVLARQPLGPASVSGSDQLVVRQDEKAIISVNCMIHVEGLGTLVNLTVRLPAGIPENFLAGNSHFLPRFTPNIETPIAFRRSIT